VDKRVSFSGEDLELAEIAETYEITFRSLVNYRESLTDNSNTRSSYFPEQLVGYSRDEFVTYFQSQIEELGRTMCLNLIAATEAKLRKDFLQRVYNRKRDNNSRALRTVYKNKGRYASLEADILDTWKNLEPSARDVIGEYKSVLQMRHWLAHGRYWVAKLGRKYDFFSVYAICENLQSNLPLF